MLLATDPKLTEKKFPLVFRDSTAWATEPLPIMTNTKVPETTEMYEMHLHIWMVSAVCNSISNGNKADSDAGLILKCKVAAGIRGYCVTKRLEIRLIKEASK